MLGGSDKQVVQSGGRAVGGNVPCQFMSGRKYKVCYGWNRSMKLLSPPVRRDRGCEVSRRTDLASLTQGQQALLPQGQKSDGNQQTDEQDKTPL
jgi:hypothetical protein